MSKLAVRTRGNSSPQGKPRVYFSCHPDDFETYFEILCEDIFSTQNCAIYYETDYTADDDVLASGLSDIQLFVVPITSKFLFQPCRARKFEYGFAMQNHIAVLPIIVEDGVDRSFAECMNRESAGYGDIQFLNRISTDNTEIPYAEKLEKLLNSILTGDALAERVRAAFDAYIFLSYRKKDRVYAKELMKMIHRIPYCRDIAIWYDEFLVPGEGWNQAIQEAMAKSHLVTLAVTPSVIEPDNFIIQHEYPDAVRAGKKIVPAEVVPTDRDVLARLFDGIDVPVDGTDGKALEKALQSLAVQENDHVPEHNFLIGLAYLGAIDVERDPERAAELIISAANAELPEAIQKLVSMYNTGEGVQRDYLEAVNWQEKLVAVLEKAKKDPLEDRDIIVALWDAGDMWQALGKTEQAQADFKKMYDLTFQRANARHSIRSKRDLAACCERLGGLYMSVGELSEARKYYENALELFKSLAEETKTVKARRDLSAIHDRMGSICKVSGDLDGAREYYMQALRLSEEISNETKDAGERRSLAVDYEGLGEICKAAGDLNGAREYYEKSLQVCTELAAETKSAFARRDLAVIYCKSGEICEEAAAGQNSPAENLSSAGEYYTKALKLFAAINEEINTLNSRTDLAKIYGRLGEFCERGEDVNGAREYYKQAIPLYKKIAIETKMPKAYDDLAYVYADLGSCGENNMELLQKAYDIYGALAEQFPDEERYSQMKDLISFNMNL